MIPGQNQVNAFVVNALCGETLILNVTATSGNVEFDLPASWAAFDCMVTNGGSNPAFFGFGTTSTTAAVLPGTGGTTNATPILAGAILSIQKNSGQTQNKYCAAICNGGQTTTLYFTAIQGS